jgi:glyoxylase-like metal-dependent hydrolase (beta-lactamase superfamily II)
MQALADHVYIEDQYPGVTLGAIVLPHGMIQIDAPPSPEDGRSWRASLLNLGGGVERWLVNLDAHPDRTLGVRTMDCTVIAHERTAQTFRSRPNTFKSQSEQTGADWEQVVGLGSIRWAPPEISFTQQMLIEWNNVPVLMEHHPGPAAGAIWIILPKDKIVFVGDAVLKAQPPFLGGANLPAWLEALELLLSPEYKGYTIVCGRGGLVSSQAVRNQQELLVEIMERLDKLAARKASPDAVEKFAEKLLPLFRTPAARQKQYEVRLRHGLHHYYVRHYRPSNRNNNDED